MTMSFVAIVAMLSLIAEAGGFLYWVEQRPTGSPTRSGAVHVAAAGAIVIGASTAILFGCQEYAYQRVLVVLWGAPLLLLFSVLTPLGVAHVIRKSRRQESSAG